VFHESNYQQLVNARTVGRLERPLVCDSSPPILEPSPDKKGQHMCWTKRGPHLLLQVRCAVLNGELPQRHQRWFHAVGTRQVGLPLNWVPHFLNGSNRHLFPERISAAIRSHVSASRAHLGMRGVVFIHGLLAQHSIAGWNELVQKAPCADWLRRCACTIRSIARASSSRCCSVVIYSLLL
jgi:hypothetical protein